MSAIDAMIARRMGPWSYRQTPAASLPPAEDVVWTNLVNGVATGNTFTKNAGGAGWNAGAHSNVSIASGADGYITWTIQGSYRVIAGLGDTPGATTTTTEINFGVFYDAFSGHTIDVYEAGVFVANIGTSSINGGEVIKVESISGVVRYYVDDVLQYTSLVGAPASALYLDCAVFDQGGEVQSATISGGS